jgi:GNAT superfamily N-acetyltransferase
VPRSGARVEDHGAFALFVKEGDGWPYYARPALGRDGIPGADDIAAVRARQRELGVAEAFEWIDEVTPGLLVTARAAGLNVLEAPLMVLGDGRWRTPEAPTGVEVRMLEPDDPALAAALAVPHVAFGAPGTQPGAAGIAERDAEAVRTAGEVERIGRRIRQGLTHMAVAELESGGPVCSGSHQPVGDVTEIVGIGTLPAARRQGLGALVTGRLVQDARERGADLVFLSAGSEDIARVYGRLGFERVGTACIAEPA